MIERNRGVRDGALTCRTFACRTFACRTFACRTSASPGPISLRIKSLARRSRLKADFARKSFRKPQHGPRAGLVRAWRLLLLGASLSFGFCHSAQSADADSDPAKAASTLPNIYLDLRTIYTTVSGNALSIGFSNPSLASALATLQSLAALTNSPGAADPAIAVDPECRRRCSADGRPHRSVLAVWRIQRQRIANQPVGLVDVRGQQLERRFSG